MAPARERNIVAKVEVESAKVPRMGQRAFGSYDPWGEYVSRR